MKLKVNKIIDEKPFLQITNEEFKRAKKLLKPLLDEYTRPQIAFRWNKLNVWRRGEFWPWSKTIYMSHRYKLNEPLNTIFTLEDFRDTVRHEISHLATHGKEKLKHGPKFARNLKILDDEIT